MKVIAHFHHNFHTIKSISNSAKPPRNAHGALISILLSLFQTLYLENLDMRKYENFHTIKSISNLRNIILH